MGGTGPVAYLLLAARAATAAPASPQDPPPSMPPPPPDSLASSEVPVHGSFSLRYRLRHASHSADQDAYGLLDLDVGDAGTTGFSGHLLVRGAADLDGHTDASGGYVFDSLEDTYGHRVRGVVYQAYADYRGDGTIAQARVGRQLVWDTPVATYFDGLRIDGRAMGSLDLKLGAYGGVPSHLYESSPRGDLILGAFGEARPWRSTRTRLDWMQVEDERLFESRENSLVRAAWWQQVGDEVDLFGNFTWLDWRGRDLDVRGSWYRGESDLVVQLDYHELLTTQRSKALEFDPFFTIAGESRPYRELRASASKGFGDHVDLTIGADVRRLADHADVGQFNREFERWFVEPALVDWPAEGMTISVTGELWDSDAERIETAGAELSQAFTKETKARLGTAYALYEYDYYASAERDHVRAWYVGVDSRCSRQLRLRGSYRYEVDAFAHHHTLQVAATWTF